MRGLQLALLIISCVLIFVIGIFNAIAATSMKAANTTNNDILNRGYQFAIGASVIDFIGLAIVITILIVLVVRTRNKIPDVIYKIFNIILILLLVASILLTSVYTTLSITSTVSNDEQKKAYRFGIFSTLINLLAILGILILLVLASGGSVQTQAVDTLRGALKKFI